MHSSPNLILFRRAPSGLDRSALNEFARTLRRRVAKGRSFSCLITDDRELRRLNQQFLQNDYATDVLSFPSAPAAHSGELMSSLGDVAISGERAAAQALAYGHSLEQEIAILMLHALLHLLGMDHETDGGRMSRTETTWRRKLGLPNGLIERVRA